MESPKPTLDPFPPPLFIVGCKRSGTTLFARVMDSHSRIAVSPDTHYYTFFRPQLHFYGDLGRLTNLKRLIDDLRDTIIVQGVMTPPETHEFLDALVEPTFEGVFTTYLGLYARSEKKVLGGEKTPDHFMYLPEIMEKFPKSPIFFIMRDPRDAALSLRKAFGFNVDDAIRMWNAAYMSYKNASGPVHLVRYEDLVQLPDETLEGVCNFVGEQYEPGMLRFFERTTERVGIVPAGRKLLGPIDTSSINNYQEMPPHEIQKIEAACAYGMEEMGYPLTANHIPAIVDITPPKKRSRVSYLMERVRYYGISWRRWRYGMTCWKIIARARLRYMLALGPSRKTE